MPPMDLSVLEAAMLPFVWVGENVVHENSLFLFFFFFFKLGIIVSHRYENILFFLLFPF